MMKQTQGRVIIEAIKRTPMTYLEMARVGRSMSPQKRVKESLQAGEEVVVTEGADGLVRWSVKQAKPYRAIWPEFRKP